MNKLAYAILMASVVMSDVSYAAFGGTRASSSGVGVSRPISRPSPTTTYKPTTSSSYSSPSNYSNSSYNSYRPNNTYQGNNYQNSGYQNNNNYRGNDYPQQPSTMRNIATTAAGVGAGILAASAITALVSSPTPGLYTHPQYPGQYFNAQGVPQAAPQQVQQSVPQQLPVDQGYGQQSAPVVVQPQVVQQPTPVIIQQQPQNNGIPFWKIVSTLIELLLLAAIAVGTAFGLFKAYQYIRKTIAETKKEMNQPNSEISKPIKIASGLITGQAVEKMEGIQVYKGIPYAAPPVGPLRWKAPQPQDIPGKRAATVQ